MLLSELFTPALSFVQVEGRSKKRLLETLSHLIAEQHSTLTSEQIFDALIARERLGSTGLGEGVAVPHCRLDDLDSGGLGAMVQLAEPIDYDAPDQQPVDLLAFLLVPKETCQEHLDSLSAIATKLSDADTRNKLRAAQSPDQLCHLMLE